MAALRHWLVLLAGVAFLTASPMSTHVHLCFDGQEPPASLHLFDAALGDHHAGTSQPHNDVDLDVARQALAKALKSLPSWLALPPIMGAPFVLSFQSLPVRVERGHVTRAALHFLVPPLRAPPL